MAVGLIFLWKCVGYPATFDVCQNVISVGGHIANVLKSGKIDATKLITHHFKLSEVEKAYDVFKHAGENHALKVIIENDICE